MSCKGECVNAIPGTNYRHASNCVDSPDFAGHKVKPVFNQNTYSTTDFCSTCNRPYVLDFDNKTPLGCEYCDPDC